jgi:hypothetical protein
MRFNWLLGGAVREFHAPGVKFSRMAPPQKIRRRISLAFLQKTGWHWHC